MKYRSTRGHFEFNFSQALSQGLAPDGGLIVPIEFPKININDLLPLTNLASLASQILKPFFEGDLLASELEDICQNVFNFPVRLKFFDEKEQFPSAVLELFHGPTAAFKDFGARFLAECLSREVNEQGRQRERVVLVATSGDTGGAVASAFFKRPQFKVCILYPKGKVSQRQEKQLCAWGENVKAFSVSGDFDDCQRLVKEAFQSAELQKNYNFISANSINLGRLLPQMIYYVYASLLYKEKTKVSPNFVIPTGNLGNAVACFWAKKIGCPINNIIMASNENRALADYYLTKKWNPQTTVATLANAMDVGKPSNVERLFDLYPQSDDLMKISNAYSVSDKEISETIKDVYIKTNYEVCPHTATAFHVAKKYSLKNSIAVATAHPAKFESIVETLLSKKIQIPLELEKLLDAPSKSIELRATLADLENELSLV